MIQCQLLSYILTTQNYSIVLNNNLNIDFFSDYVDEFTFIQNHYNTYGNVPDKATFFATFSDFDLVEVNESENYLIDALYEDLNKRKLAKTFNTIRKLINEDKTNEALDFYINSSQDSIKSRHLTSIDLIQDTSRYDSYLERCNDFSKFFIKTGFNELDKLIGGWDRYEELATIVARPGVGKSWVLLKCAIAALEQGLRVGIYSGEMSEQKVGYRFDTLVSHLSNYGITKGNRDLQNEYKKHIDSLKDRYVGCLKVLTPAMINGVAGVTSLRAFIEKESLDILFIDQHSLLEDDRKAKDPVTRASNISRDLKNLQVLKKIPIIAVSQQNREKTDGVATTANVAQTDRISQDSTILLFLEQKDKILTVSLIKSRDSEMGKSIKYFVNLNEGTFVYVPEEGNALEGEGSKELYEEFEQEPF